MYELTNAISKAFEIKKMKSLCNYPSCKNKPKKEFFIYEYTTKRIIGIATLYLCDEHIKEARNLMINLRELDPKIFIEKKEKDIK